MLRIKNAEWACTDLRSAVHSEDGNILVDLSPAALPVSPDTRLESLDLRIAPFCLLLALRRRRRRR